MPWRKVILQVYFDFKMLNEYDPRIHWPRAYEQPFISQCQWCWPDQASGSSLAGLAAGDKVSEVGGGQEVRVTYVLSRVAGTSILCKHICPSVPVPGVWYMSGWTLIPLERTAPPSPGYLHQFIRKLKIHSSLVSTNVILTVQSTCLLFTIEKYLNYFKFQSTWLLRFQGYKEGISAAFVFLLLIVKVFWVKKFQFHLEMIKPQYSE